MRWSDKRQEGLQRMDFREKYRDIILVDERGRIEYFNVDSIERFDLRPEELIGTRVTQLYENLDENSSTLMRAVINGQESLNCEQTLVTREGHHVGQVSDTFCIYREGKVIGAVEFADYDDKWAEEDKKTSDESEQPLTLDDFLGESAAVKKLKTKVKKVINLDSPVLLMGEGGTGKEMLARIIHDSSKRAEKNFVYVNCGAVPETLFEGILFGIHKGSFTDAEEKKGLFHLADGGTLFLDEMNSMPLAIQGKILRAIEEKRILPVGGEETFVDVRIIASFGGNVKELMEGSRLRKDLFFRLAVLQFFIPPLRERSEDILPLTEYYIEKYSQKVYKNIAGLDEEAMAFFQQYEWPGNVRELKNTVEEAVHLAETEYIRYDDFRERFERSGAADRRDDMLRELQAFQTSGQNLLEYMEAKERAWISQAMDEAEGNVSKASGALGISSQNLKYKLGKR